MYIRLNKLFLSLAALFFSSIVYSSEDSFLISPIEATTDSAYWHNASDALNESFFIHVTGNHKCNQFKKKWRRKQCWRNHNRKNRRVFVCHVKWWKGKFNTRRIRLGKARWLVRSRPRQWKWGKCENIISPAAA